MYRVHRGMEDGQAFQFSVQEREHAQYKQELAASTAQCHKHLKQLQAHRETLKRDRTASKTRYRQLVLRLHEKVRQWHIFADLWNIPSGHEHYVSTMQKFKRKFLGIEHAYKQSSLLYVEMIDDCVKSAMPVMDKYLEHRMLLLAECQPDVLDTTVPDEHDYWGQQHLVTEHMWDRCIG